MVRTFTTYLVMKAIESCINSKAFGPDKLSIFHLKHLLGPRVIEYITTLFNLSTTTCQTNDRKATLQALHTDKVVKSHRRNVVLDGRPLPISNEERDLTRKERSTLAQLRSGYCRLLGSYKSRIKKDASLNVCAYCGTTPHDVKHLFVCPAPQLQ